MRQLSCLIPDESVAHIGKERWMVSYADFITLLFVVFLVLYANAPKKASDMSNVLKEMGSVTRGSPPKNQQDLITELELALEGRIQPGDVTLIARQAGVLVEIKDTALFSSGTAKATQDSIGVLDTLAAVLAVRTNLVEVEGHTDNIPIQSAQFASNWELSSARAAGVTRTLQERGVAGERLMALGRSDTKPKASNESGVGRSQNRRVTLFVRDIERN